MPTAQQIPPLKAHQAVFFPFRNACPMPSILKTISDSLFFSVRMPVTCFLFILLQTFLSLPAAALSRYGRQEDGHIAVYSARGCTALHRNICYDLQERVRSAANNLAPSYFCFFCSYCSRVPLNGNMRLTLRAPSNLNDFQALPDYCCNNATSDCTPNGKEPPAPNPPSAIRRRCW